MSYLLATLLITSSTLKLCLCYNLISLGATTTNQSVTSPMRDPFAAGSDPFGSSAAAKSPQAGAGQQQANFSADWGNAFNKSDPFAADDNWAASAANTATNTNVTSPTANAPRGFDTATNNWASFNDDGTYSLAFHYYSNLVLVWLLVALVFYNCALFDNNYHNRNRSFSKLFCVSCVCFDKTRSSVAQFKIQSACLTKMIATNSRIRTILSALLLNIAYQVTMRNNMLK